MIFDLHTHTNLSTCAGRDNTWEVLLCRAQEAGVEVLSVTDHNTVGFYTENKDIEKYFSGRIVPGIEFSVALDGVAIELLAYNFDIDTISKWAYEKYGTPKSRQEKMVKALELLVQEHGLEYDYSTTFDGSVYAHEFVLNNLLKYDSSKCLLASYGVYDRTDFYRISGANTEFPLYLDMDKIWPTAEEIIDVVHSAHGVVVFAHPYNYNEKVDVYNALEKLYLKGVDGIEVYHPSCNQEELERLENFAMSHNLLITGGSDYHGIPRHNDMGVNVEKENSLQYWRKI